MKKRPVLKLNVNTVIIAITVVVSAVMVVRGVMNQPAISASSVRAESLKADIEYEIQRKEEINAMMEKVGTDEYIEKIAREKLGMIKADEIVFVDISGQ